MNDLDPAIDQYLDDHRQQFEDELCELLRIPSVSTDSRCRDSVRQAGEWVAGRLGSLGMATELIHTQRHPIVYAESPPVATTSNTPRVRRSSEMSKVPPPRSYTA